jgi:hypothetical protein
MFTTVVDLRQRPLALIAARSLIVLDEHGLGFLGSACRISSRGAPSVSSAVLIRYPQAKCE